jgi:hypothetical protein
MTLFLCIRHESVSVARLGPLLDLHLLGMDVKRYVSDNVQKVGFH